MFGRSRSGCKHKHRSQSPHKRRIFITEAHAARPHKTIEFAVKMPGVAGDVKVLTEKTIRIPFGLLVGFSAAVTPSMFAYQPKHPNWAANERTGKDKGATKSVQAWMMRFVWWVG